MSGVESVDDHIRPSCANCGKAEIDEVKLSACPGGCDLARYCSDDCQEDHREKHEKACKKRRTKLLEEILFRQPESSHLGDCPICFVPLPLDKNYSTLMPCCSKLVCDGCIYAFPKPVCPFCRHARPGSDKEADELTMTRVDASDPVAIRQLGSKAYFEGDYAGAIEYFLKAAKLGEVEAHFCLTMIHIRGESVEIDEKKAVCHAMEAAIGGHPDARVYLGSLEAKAGRDDRAVKHFMIAANLGDNKAIEALKIGYKEGHVSKDDMAVAFRAHQAAEDATKSPQRNVAKLHRLLED